MWSKIEGSPLFLIGGLIVLVIGVRGLWQTTIEPRIYGS